MGVQIHMRHGNGEYNNSYARVEDMEVQHDNEEYNNSYARVEDTGIQIHMRPCAHVEDFVDDRDVVIHAKGSCDPCTKKEKEVIANDYNLDINKPKINGYTLIGNVSGEDLGLGGQNAYKELSYIKDYLYDVYYDGLDYDYAYNYFLNDETKDSIFGCSVVRKGNLYGRNFDWTYDENAEFIVKTHHVNNRYAVMGVAGGISDLTNTVVKKRLYNKAYKILPFRLLDGINEKGVVINSNVVPTDKGINEKTIPAIEEKIEICNRMIPRYVLDHFATAKSAAEYLRDYVSIYSSKTLVDKGYEIHWIIADEKETYLIEIIENTVRITDMTENSNSLLAGKSYMTNFYLSDITLNDNNKVYTPEYRDGDNNAMTYNHITPHGAGLERYNLIVDNYDNITNKEDLRNLLSALKYTNAYRLSTTPAWNTEFVGLDDLTVVSTPEEYRPILKKAADIFAARTREEGTIYSGTWQTTHSSIYDLTNRTLSIVVQEDGEELEFEYSELIPIDPVAQGNYPELKNKPRINGVELVGNKTTADLLIDQDFVKDDNYTHTDNNFTNALKEKLENFSEIQISNSEPTDTNIKLWYQIDSDIDLDNFGADITGNDLNITYQDDLGLDFNIENNELIVTNDIEDLDFIINENKEMEVSYGD